MDKFTNPILMFSGGKDSLACLYLLQEKLEHIYVVWANTGKNFPETLKVIEEAKRLCPKWVELRSDKAAQWAEYGLPSDIVPFKSTNEGHVVTDTQGIKLQHSSDCCRANILEPILEFATAIGSNLLITGQKVSDAYKGSSRDGQSIAGITFHYPLENWSQDEVLYYLSGKLGKLPEHLKLNHSSLDCYDCTAYLKDTQDLHKYVKRKHPAIHADFLSNLHLIKATLNEPLELINSHLQESSING